jgi:SAM-dependent methyltransferase
MTAHESWVPQDTDTSKANTARVYDYWLGGSHNFRADQDVARALIAVEPNIRAVARANRAFMMRAVRFMARAGIRQFLDVGSGIPTEQNVHEVAQQATPGARVVYVDNDDVAVSHSRLLLDGNQDAAAVYADLREPARILGDPATEKLIDFGQPVGLLLTSVLHFLPDTDEPHRLVAEFRDALAPGSYLLISHGTREAKQEVGEAFETVYNSRVSNSAHVRPRQEIIRFFDGFTLVEPGLVYTPQWRPDSGTELPDDPRDFWLLAGDGIRNVRD